MSSLTIGLDWQWWRIGIRGSDMGRVGKTIASLYDAIVDFTPLDFGGFLSSTRFAMMGLVVEEDSTLPAKDLITMQ